MVEHLSCSKMCLAGFTLIFLSSGLPCDECKYMSEQRVKVRNAVDHETRASQEHVQSLLKQIMSPPSALNLWVTLFFPVLGHTCSSSWCPHLAVIHLFTVSNSIIMFPNEPVFHDSLSPCGLFLLGPQFLCHYTSCPHTGFPVITLLPQKIYPLITLPSSPAFLLGLFEQVAQALSITFVE